MARRGALALGNALCWPSDKIVEYTTARQRRAFGFWNIVFALVFAIPFGRNVMYVTVLSIVALFPNVTSETPVEHEDVPDN